MAGIRKSKIHFYLNRMKARGFSASRVLDGTGLTEQGVLQVRFHGAPDAYRRIIRNMLSLTGDPRLGIALGSEFKISDPGVLGYAALSSATLAQVCELMQRYYSLNEYIQRPRTTSRATAGTASYTNPFRSVACCLSQWKSSRAAASRYPRASRTAPS